jgi:hypothetical protein
MGLKAQAPEIQYVNGRLSVWYPDVRVAPRVCPRTRMKRVFCPCTPCRVLRRRKHSTGCSCYLCFADRAGKFIDDLGRRTEARRWVWFVTLTFRTPHFPWARHFPVEQPMPAPDFVHHHFDAMIKWIEREVHHPVEFFTADQFGSKGGRLHLHCGLSWPGLFPYRWKSLQAMLWDGTGAKDNPLLKNGAGFNRILPWEQDAAYYIARYIGRDAHRAHWDWNVGIREPPIRLLPSVGRKDVAVSPVPHASSRMYGQTAWRWHR